MCVELSMMQPYKLVSHIQILFDSLFVECIEKYSTEYGALLSH
jgi:hypothetical protein